MKKISADGLKSERDSLRAELDRSKEGETVDEFYEKLDLCYALTYFLDRMGYENFEEEFLNAETYIKEKYQDEIEFPSFLTKRRALLLKEYLPIKDKIPHVLSQIAYGAFYEGDEEIRKKDYEKALKYFKTKKRDFVYSWELPLLYPIFWMEDWTHEDIFSALFPTSTEEDDDPEMKELEDNFRFILAELIEKNKFHLSLYFWTVYREKILKCVREWSSRGFTSEAWPLII